ncbi:hypothetical protein AAMO2058_000323400 [Amorphochlora amoebiformis]
MKSHTVLFILCRDGHVHVHRTGYLTGDLASSHASTTATEASQSIRSVRQDSFSEGRRERRGFSREQYQPQIHLLDVSRLLNMHATRPYAMYITSEKTEQKHVTMMNSVTFCKPSRADRIF